MQNQFSGGRGAVERWLETPRGRSLIRRQRRQLLEVLPHLFGYRLLQVGDWSLDRELLESSATLCHWVLGRAGAAGADVIMDGQSLPICSGCVDAVILPHSLELAASPHHLLREVDRILCDHGHVVILGFNPYAPWTLWSRIARRGRGGEMVRERRCYSPGRISDWLDLLDFDVAAVNRFGAGFSYPRASAFAMAYMIVARKRVVPLTPIKSPWKPRTAAVPGGMPEPTSQVGQALHKTA